MRILQINKFFYLKGGPERYMFKLSELLRAKGHEIAFFSMRHDKNKASQWSQYFVKNIDYNKRQNLKEQIKIFKNTLYSHEAEKKISKLIDDFRPDIAHVHNFNHQLTPSILFALKRKKVPIVMTMHDYKLVCPSYSMLNHGRICELCKGKKFYHCFRTRCHKNSFNKSLAVTIESYLHHNILDSYRFINYFICPSKFIMNKVREMGLRGNFVHLPHFVRSYEWKPLDGKESNKIVYYGRLSPEKGVWTLIEAVKELSVNLTIIGDGPLKNLIEERVKHDEIKNIKLFGHLDGNRLVEEISKNTFLIIPSECYEVFGLVVIEAFALGLPVIGANIGGIPEAVKNGEAGLLFEPGNVENLRDKIKQLLADPDKVAQMGRNAQALVEKEYNVELHYERLMKVYNNAIYPH